MKLLFFLFKILGIIGTLFLAITALGYLIYCCVILLWAPPQQGFKNHDAIIVLTGGPNRIETGFHLLLENKAPKLLISGVLNEISLPEVIKNNTENFQNTDISSLLKHCCIDIDDIAKTTETNAEESVKWTRKNDLKNIILVTSVAHMPRAYLLFATKMPKNVNITPYPIRKKRRLDLVMSWQFWSYAAREYIKFNGSWIRLARK